MSDAANKSDLSFVTTTELIDELFSRLKAGVVIGLPLINEEKVIERGCGSVRWTDGAMRMYQMRIRHEIQRNGEGAR